MLFSSFNFIFAFLTAFFISYFLIEDKYKNVVIFLYSIAFYVIGCIKTPIYIFIFVIALLVNYALISKKYYRLLLALNVLLIIVIKLDVFKIGVPLGLSFYTFSFISLVIDLSKKEGRISIFEFLQYSLFFPKLISGPITRHKDFMIDYNKKKISKENIYSGICLFCIGLGFKCILADNIYNIINQINVYGIDSVSTLTTWILMYAYTMNLYFDFAGYSLMAIGIAKIIGFMLPTNFNEPFSSHSISEFWRRWHMTLESFFKEYIYIPLGGNKRGISRQIVNILIVWILTGLWHGFSINYIIWALCIGVLIVIEKMGLAKVFDKYKYLGLVFVLLFIPITFVFFSTEDLNYIGDFFTKAFDVGNIIPKDDFYIIIGRYFKVFILGIIFITKYPRALYEKIKGHKVIMYVICVVIFIISIYMLKVGEHDAFRYFSF